MTTLVDRPHTALLVIDVQNGVVDHAHDRARVVANVAALVERARSAGVAVIWVQDHGGELVRDSEPWQLVPELARRDDEPLVHKAYPDAFEETDLAAVLAGGRVGRLVVAGAQTDQCVRSTLHGAFTRGYDAILVADAHTTEDLTAYGAPSPEQVVAHTNLYWRHQTAPGRTAGVVDTADVEFAATPAAT